MAQEQCRPAIPWSHQPPYSGPESLLAWKGQCRSLLRPSQPGRAHPPPPFPLSLPDLPSALWEVTAAIKGKKPPCPQNINSKLEKKNKKGSWFILGPQGGDEREEGGSGLQSAP